VTERLRFSLETMRRLWPRYAFAAVPLLGVVELVAHVAETRPGASDADWGAARDFVAANAKPEDLVAFAPKWVDPVGREHFGPSIATLEREARPDETRFPRAFEVSVHGGRLRALADWKRVDEKRFGGVTVTTWENPSPAHVLDDLVSLVDPRRMHVSRGDADCPFARGAAQSGGLGFGPAIPGDRFVCQGGGAFVGMSVVADLDYVPHRCIYAPPAGSPPTHIRFEGVRFGHSLHGHHAIYVEAERDRKGQPVTLTFRAGDALLGSIEHRDGDGWKPFELDTSALAGTTGDLVAEVSGQGERRMYCFEADTR
jgi:hypothetical protein